MKIQIFVPCFIDQLYPDVAFSMVKVLEKFDCIVRYNPNQTCCGQPAFNAGFWGESKDICKKFLDDFGGTDAYIVAPSASCVGFVKNYYTKLFENSPYDGIVKDVQARIYEFSDFLINVMHVDNIGAALTAKATYHDSCAALRECKIKKEPRQLLSKVKGLELVEMTDNETCCGFGGTFSVKFEPISIAMADQKITHAQAVEADLIISTDMSCLMHIDGCIKHQNKHIKVMHLAEVLASGW